MADYWLKYGGPNVSNMANWTSFSLFASSSSATFSFTINERIKLEYATPSGIYVDMLISNPGTLSSNANLQASAMNPTTSPYYININANTNPGGWFYLPFHYITDVYQWKLTLTAGTKGTINGYYTYGVRYNIPGKDAEGASIGGAKARIYKELLWGYPYSMINGDKPNDGTQIIVNNFTYDSKFGSMTKPSSNTALDDTYYNNVIAYLGNGTTRYTG